MNEHAKCALDALRRAAQDSDYDYGECWHRDLHYFGSTPAMLEDACDYLEQYITSLEGDGGAV